MLVSIPIFCYLLVLSYPHPLLARLSSCFKCQKPEPWTNSNLNRFGRNQEEKKWAYSLPITHFYHTTIPQRLGQERVRKFSSEPRHWLAAEKWALYCDCPQYSQAILWEVGPEGPVAHIIIEKFRESSDEKRAVWPYRTNKTLVNNRSSSELNMTKCGGSYMSKSAHK